MRIRVAAAVALVLLTASCRSRGAPTEPIAPDEAAWNIRRPDSDAVRQYASDLERLNPGQVGPFDAGDGLILPEAEAVALLFNPDLRQARLEAQVPVIGAAYAGLPDDPRLELDFLRILQGIATPWIAINSLKFTVPLTGRLKGQRAEALAEATAAMRAAHVAEWTLVVRLREAWNRWSATGERIKLIEEHLASVDGVLKIAQAQRDAEQIGATQVRVLELERVTRSGDLIALRMKHKQQSLNLKELLGLRPYADVSLVPEFTPDPAHIDRHAEEAQLKRVNLQLALAEAEFLTADRTLRLEVAKRFSDLEIGPLFESEQGIERLGAGVGIDLPLWNRNRRAITEACAARRAARAAYQARYQGLIAALAFSRAEGDATSRQSAWLKEKVAPMADLQLADVRRLGELGDMDVLILKDALSTVLQTKLQLLDARVERALASNRRRALVDPLRTPTAESIRK